MQLYRTDYIGHEIDRFFRTTKAALPGTVAIGASMAQHLGLTFGEPVSGIITVSDGAGQPLFGGTPRDPIHAARRTLTDLKGIGYPYDVYQLFCAAHAEWKIFGDAYAARQEDAGSRLQSYAADIDLRTGSRDRRSLLP